MKTIVSILLILCTMICSVSCFDGRNSEVGIMTDDRGEGIPISKDTRIAALHSSFADCWLLAGGELVGVTEDAIEDHGLLCGNAAVVGTAKTVNLEALVASGAEVVFLSLDLAAHLEAEAVISDLGITCAYFRIDSFLDYSSVMKRFTEITGRDDLYEKNVTEVGERIDAILAKLPDTAGESVLLMRAFSSGIKAKSDDNLAGVILEELGANNVIDGEESSIEDISLEYIAAKNPDSIFILTMGSEEAALAYLEANLYGSRVWQELDAVVNGRVFLLPKELYHYKPCERWAESYEYLAKILYPAIYE